MFKIFRTHICSINIRNATLKVSGAVRQLQLKLGVKRLKETITNRLMVFDRKSLRKIFDPTYENGSWRMKTNQKMDKLTKHENIINFARAQRLGWYGYIERKQEIRMVKSTHSWKPISKRAMAGPKIRWEEDVRKDIQRLKVPNWKTLVQERGRCKEVVGKAKTLH